MVKNFYLLLNVKLFTIRRDDNEIDWNRRNQLDAFDQPSLTAIYSKPFSDQAEIELCEISDLPAFNEPEDRTAPAAVQALSEKIEAADGVIISTPEYDHSIPAVLKHD